MSLVAREAITPTNQSPIFLIVTWILQAAVLLAVGVKVVLLHSSIGVPTDDWCILAAAVLSIAQVVAVSFQGINGIGKVQASLSHSRLNIYQKAGYAGEILHILVLATSKLSVVIFIHHITPFKRYRRRAIGIGASIILWSLASLLVAAFQCDNPREWEFVKGQCIDQNAFWTSYSCINIVTEIVLIVVPVEMFHNLIKDGYKKVILMLCFSLRISVVAVIALQLYYIHHPVYPTDSTPYPSNNSDLTFSTWPVFLTAQINQCLSIMTTCVPFLRTLFLGLETGMIQTGHVSGRQLSVAVTNTWNERSQTRTYRSSSSRYRSWRFPSNGTTLVGSTRPNSETTITSALRNPSDASTLVEPLRSPMSPMFNITGSGALISPTRTDSRPLPERAYSRRHVSMIVEDEEEERRSLVMPNAELGNEAVDALPLDRPRYMLDVAIPQARLSISWRSSWRSSFSRLSDS